MSTREQLEKQVLVAGELAARMAGDPWWGWKPTPRQIPFVKAVLGGEVSEAWLIAANRTGKTDAAAFCGAGLARFGANVPLYSPFAANGRPTKGWVVSATSGASRTVVQPKYFDNGMGAVESHAPFIPKREIANWNVNDQTLKLRNGSIIEFKSAEQKTISFAGSGLDWVHIDEECPKTIYDELAIQNDIKQAGV